jgi:hypothetical protein
MPQYFVVPHPFPYDLMGFWRFRDALIQADSAEDAAKKKKYSGRVKVINLNDGDVFEVSTTCTTTVAKV